MHRSLLPLALASLGFVLLRLVMNMPLLEWQIGEIVTDFPSTYEVEILPSPWEAKLGDSLSDGSYILRKIYVTGDESFCRKENLKFIVRRLHQDELIEQVLNADQKNTSWLYTWGLIELILSGIYIWWFITGYKQGSAFQAVIFTGIAGIICVFLILTSRFLGYQLGAFELSDCYGTITFNAKLSKVHYETVLLLLAIILSELGALGVMTHQIVLAFREGRGMRD